MQSAENRVPGQRRLNGDFSRFKVTNFADQNLVRILPQNRSQRRSKRHPNLVVNRNLHDPVNVILNRVFGGDQLVFDAV